MNAKKLKIKKLNGAYGVCRIEHDRPIPKWAEGTEFLSITRTSDELSIVCKQDSIPDDIKCERNWRVLKIEGPLDFSLIGILSSISTTLADSGISIFAVSTYDTDYILVRDEKFNKAVDVLSGEGYTIVD